MTLHERVMSQLHDKLPDLDHFLKKYILKVQDSRRRALSAHDSLPQRLGTV
jgi:hypothetical protein